MAKQSDKKKSTKPGKKRRAGKASGEDQTRSGKGSESADQGQQKQAKVSKALTSAKSAAAKLKENPVVTEIVAAALVATAAALKDPRKARRMAADAGEELEEAGKTVARKSGALWDLALDIARRSIDALEGGEEKPKRKKRSKPGK